MKVFVIPCLAALSLYLTGCEDNASADTPSEPYTNFFTPMPEAAVYPPDNPFSVEKERLGEFLFWDPILSGQMNIACATCHHPDFAWADGREVSVGVDGMGLGPDRQGNMLTPLHSPSILNVAFTGIVDTNPPADFVSGGYFWRLRVQTLEEQAVTPIRSALEMRSESFTEDEIFPEIISRLQGIPEYVQLFQDAFGGTDPITEENIAKAIATFERKLITKRTRFDEFLAGDETALVWPEIRAVNTFINAGCTDCHSGPMLSDFVIHDDKRIFPEKDAVRTPPLRNVELTPPFMHDGSRPTLGTAIDIYEERDDLGVTLGDHDFDTIRVFMLLLTETDFYRDVPVYVPSNLPVGGDIL